MGFLCALCFVGGTLGSDVGAYSCGPFLLAPSPRSITIVVDHKKEVPATLTIRLPGGRDAAVTVVRGNARHHVFQIQDLSPATTYEYRITSGRELDSGLHTFRTLPAEPDRYRLVVLGDSRSFPLTWKRVAARVNERERDALFIIGTGDYPADGRDYDQWVDQFFRPAQRLLARMPLIPAIGNHEMTRPHVDLAATVPDPSHYFSLFELPGNERWYRVDYRFITLLILDSNSSMEPSRAQYKWLLGQLQGRRNRFTLVAFHHPPYTSGPHAQAAPDGTPKEWPIDQARRFLVPLFDMYGVDLVLNGHDHLYERSERQGITYVVTGGAGAPLYAVNTVKNPFQRFAKSIHHYLTLDVSEKSIELAAVDIQGRVFDHHTVAVSASNLLRRKHALLAEFWAGLRFGVAGVQATEVPVALVNPFDHPLTVTLAAGPGVEKLRVVLPPGDRTNGRMPVPAVLREVSTTPWDARVTQSVTVSLHGRDQALVLDHTEQRQVALVRPFYPAPFLEKFTLDGNHDEGAPSPEVQMGATASGFVVRGAANYKGATDLSAGVRCAWTNGGLWLAADVRDDGVPAAPDAPLFESDSVHVLFAAPDAADGLEELSLFVFAIGANGRASVTPASSPAAQVHVARTDQGWKCEAFIPWAATGLSKTPTKGRPLRFDVLVVDRDAGPDNPISYHRLFCNHLLNNDARAFGELELN